MQGLPRGKPLTGAFLLRGERHRLTILNGRLALFTFMAVGTFGCVSSANKPCLKSGRRLQVFGMAALPRVTGRISQSGLGALIGSVEDEETGGGVPTATVQLRINRSSKPLMVVSGDTLGGFLFRDIDPGKYLVEVSGLTYGRIALPFEVRGGTVDTVRFRLRFNPLYLLCETVRTS